MKKTILIGLFGLLAAFTVAARPQVDLSSLVEEGLKITLQAVAYRLRCQPSMTGVRAISTAWKAICRTQIGTASARPCTSSTLGFTLILRIRWTSGVLSWVTPMLRGGLWNRPSRSASATHAILLA